MQSMLWIAFGLVLGVLLQANPAAAAGPKLLDVVGDVRMVSRFSYDPVTYQPRQDVFDMVYISATFDQPLYVKALDGSRYRLEEVWHTAEASHVLDLVELRCPHGRNFKLESSTSVYPQQCFKEPKTNNNTRLASLRGSDASMRLVTPQPQHKWLSQVFAESSTFIDFNRDLDALAERTTDAVTDAHGSTISQTTPKSWISSQPDANVLPLLFISRHYPSERNEVNAQTQFVSKLKLCASQTQAQLTQDDLTQCTLVVKSPKETNGIALTNSRGHVIETGQVPRLFLDGRVRSDPIAAPIQISRGLPVRLWTPAAIPVQATTVSADANLSSPQESVYLPVAPNTDLEASSHEVHVERRRAALLAELERRRKSCTRHIDDQRTVFLETSSGAADAVIQPVLDLFIGTFVDQISDLVLSDVSEQLASNMGHAISGPLVDLVVVYSMRVVPRNVTHMISDFVASHLVKLLATSVPNMVAGTLAGRVYDYATPLIREKLVRILSQTLTNQISDGLSDLIARSLPIQLTSKLTRSITHALVPSVARGVSVTYHFTYLCFLCNHFKAHCSDCNHLQVSQHRMQYFAAHYSEYYSGYYGDYYRDALHMMQTLDFTGTSRPPGKAEVDNLVVTAAEAAAKAGSATEMHDIGGTGSGGYGGGTGTPGLAEGAADNGKKNKPATRIIPESDTAKSVENVQSLYTRHYAAKKDAAEGHTSARWGQHAEPGSLGEDVGKSEPHEPPALIE